MIADFAFVLCAVDQAVKYILSQPDGKYPHSSLSVNWRGTPAERICSSLEAGAVLWRTGFDRLCAHHFALLLPGCIETVLVYDFLPLLGNPAITCCPCRSLADLVAQRQL